MGRRDKERIARIIVGDEKPHRNETTESLMMRCAVCGNVFSEARVGDHLKECQPMGAKCAKCGKRIKGPEFMEHWQNCKGN